ncbi:MAG: phosphoribosylformylglycinamidine synthase I [Verrucomicrobia bacterium]|nr:phosphoribosylformylglycinamidine synthase I [Verrucomicrobiota bacterium]MDA1065670.1 phosphoribosylformylglycinamidine synthase I [Verrucomicrobiota bacterium]
MIRVAIIQFPGSNCETESIAAIRRAGMEPVEFLWNQSYELLEAFDGYVIVGGFSYEDRSRAGVIASLDPVMKIIRQQSETGKPVLGICNGAQILVETGLVPGLRDYRVGMALAPNRREKDGHILGTGFYNVFAHLRMNGASNKTAFTRHLEEGSTIHIPLAHAEGRFVIPDELLSEMIASGQTPFQYSDAEGEISEGFPINPNGSVHNLAAVTNPAGNVMAIMPHPERVPAGDPIFTSMREYIEEKQVKESKSCAFNPPKATVGKYKAKLNGFEIPINLLITDNTAHTVQKALEVAGIKANITRKTHWEVDLGDANGTVKEDIIQTGELFNSNKEYITEIPTDDSKIRILVHDKDDFVGKQKLDTLKDRFHISGIKEIKRSTLWEIELADPEDQETLNQIFNTHILWNPFFQDAVYYS